MDGEELPGISEAFHALEYNQQLVQFADSKAGNLIVINSLFIAAAGVTGSEEGGWGFDILQFSLILASALAVLICLGVIMTRGRADELEEADFYFFVDILKRPNPKIYSYEFRSTCVQEHMDGVLHRAYVVAQIAAGKFARFKVAQLFTLLGAAIWLLDNLLSVLF